ncbi:MAG: type II toxin-antitoxin system PemK/MazF family toxin [Methylococcales bacterium]
MVIKREEIWWASMGQPRGSEPGYRRPVVITSSNAFNESFIQTVVVVVITTNLRLANAPGNLKILKTKSGLHRDSVVNVSQIITLDKSFLTERIGRLNSKQIILLNEGIRLVLGI